LTQIFGTIVHIDPIKVKFVDRGHRSKFTDRVILARMYVTVDDCTTGDLWRMRLNESGRYDLVVAFLLRIWTRDSVTALGRFHS